MYIIKTFPRHFWRILNSRLPFAVNVTKNLSNSSLSKYPEINSQLKDRVHKFSYLLLESVGDSIQLRVLFFNKIGKIECIQAAILF